MATEVMTQYLALLTRSPLAHLSYVIAFCPLNWPWAGPWGIGGFSSSLEFNLKEEGKSEEQIITGSTFKVQRLSNKSYMASR